MTKVVHEPVALGVATRTRIGHESGEGAVAIHRFALEGLFEKAARALVGAVWCVSMTLTQLGLEFRVENARFIDWNQRLLQDSQVLVRVKGRFALRP